MNGAVNSVLISRCRPWWPTATVSAALQVRHCSRGRSYGGEEDGPALTDILPKGFCSSTALPEVEEIRSSSKPRRPNKSVETQNRRDTCSYDFITKKTREVLLFVVCFLGNFYNCLWKRKSKYNSMFQLQAFFSKFHKGLFSLLQIVSPSNKSCPPPAFLFPPME